MAYLRQVRRGDRFRTPGGDVVEITRVGQRGPWVDIRVIQPHGATWTKRMPRGVPESWRRL
jgi:hypothetical protein